MDGIEEMTIEELARLLGCGIPLAQDLYELGDRDCELILASSRECNNVEQLKTKLLIERLTSIDVEFENVWTEIGRILHEI